MRDTNQSEELISSLTETLLASNTGKKTKMLDTKSPCEIHRALLAEYLALLEKVRAAQLERAERGLRPSMDSVAVKPLLQELTVENWALAQAGG